MSANVKIRRRFRTDWFRVLADLRKHGNLEQTRVAELIEVPLATLRGWKAGSEPAHNYGHALLELWAEVMAADLSARPMTTE